MPWRKRLAVIGAALLGVALVAVGVVRARGGHLAEGALVAGATAALALCVLHALWPRFDLGGRSLRRGGRGRRLFALTFDDGPSSDTPAVLDALERAGARATFFVLGTAAERRPELVREISRRGHEVALHGHSHARLALAGPGHVARELDRCAGAVRHAGVEPAPFFRAPHGWKGPFLGAALRRRGLTLVAWTRGVWDTERPGSEEIAARASRRPRAGEILLLHDGCGTPGIDPRRDQTAAAIPEIVRRWREAGFEPVTVGALAASTPPGTAGRAASGGRAVGLVAIVALAAVAAARLDLRAVLASLAGASLPLLAVAAGANLLSLAAHASRWRAVVAPAGSVRYRDAFATLVAGFAAGLVLPARGGDVLRAHLLATRAGLSTTAVVAASALDYVVGTIALVPVLGAVALTAPLPSWGLRALGAVAALGAAAASIAWLLRPHPDGVRLPGAVGGMLGRLQAGLAAVRQPKALVGSLAWGFAGWAAEGMIAMATLAALGLPASVASAALVVLAGTVGSVVAVAPASAGTFEAATALVVAGLGAPADAALAFALAFRAVHAVPVAVVGGAVLVRDALSRRGSSLRRPAPETASDVEESPPPVRRS